MDDSVRGERRGHRHRAPAQFPGHLGRILDTVAPEYRYQNSNSLDITSDDAKAFGIALVQKVRRILRRRGLREYFNMGCDEFANDLYSSGGMGFGHLVSAGRYGDFADYVNSLAGVLKSLDLTPGPSMTASTII